MILDRYRNNKCNIEFKIHSKIKFLSILIYNVQTKCSLNLN